MSIEKAKLVVELLEMVADNKMDAKLALSKWPDIDSESDDLIAISWHDLSHFEADSDIRHKDKEYSKYQKRLLKKRASEIRSKLRSSKFE